MANYESVTRSNYFHVKDEDAFSKFMDTVSDDDMHCWSDKDENGNTLHAFGYPLSENSKKYLSQYIELSDKTVLAIGKHAMRYALHTDICAYYKDMEDFFSDWCSIGYSRTEARKLMHGGHGEFMKLPDGLGYIRFVI